MLDIFLMVKIERTSILPSSKIGNTDVVHITSLQDGVTIFSPFYQGGGITSYLALQGHVLAREGYLLVGMREGHSWWTGKLRSQEGAPGLG